MLSRFTSTGFAALAALALSACGPLTPAERAEEQGLRTANGLSPNGLSQNGLSQNGLSQNGLSQNGLSQNGLSQNGLSSNFSIWFNEDPARSEVVMQYVVRCAVPSGQVRTWTNKATGALHTWSGLLGLAPGWASGLPATVLEQQVITACLAGHVNKYGLSVPISVGGRGTGGTAIRYETGELTTFLTKEACFFGNFFGSDGVFVAVDHNPWNGRTTSARACGLENRTGFSIDCPPIQVVVGTCADYCTLDKAKTFYESCTYGGKTYRPITTRLRSQDVYSCGDGVCQFTESCGAGNTWDSCGPDCGPCP